METQDIVHTLERHSARHGVPSNVFVDSGSQLVALQSVTLSLRDLSLQVHRDMGIVVKVSNPKSHEERGRVEAKVKTLREMLEKFSINNNHPVTLIAWETIFAKIANEIDSLPLCKGNSSNNQDFGFEIITPNRLKLGRNNNRSLDNSITLNSSTDTQLLEASRKCQTVWYQLFLDRLHYLIPKPAKWSQTDSVCVGDICVFVFKDSSIEKNWTWSLGRVVEASKRKLSIDYFPRGKKTPGVVERNPRQVSVIHSASDLPVNTLEYFQKHASAP